MVPTPGDVTVLRTHPRRAAILFNPRARQFVVYINERPLVFHGVHRYLNRHFPAAPRSTPAAPRVPVPPAADRARFTAYVEQHAVQTGIEGGIAVHGELERMLNGTVRAAEDPRVRMFVPRFMRTGYVAFRGGQEYPLWDDTLGYATHVDAVVWDPRGQCLVVLEYKTTSSAAFATSPAPCRGPFRHVLHGTSPKDRALAQAILACLTLWRHYGLRAYPEVWCMGVDNLRRYTLNRAVFDAARAIMYRELRG